MSVEILMDLINGQPPSAGADADAGEALPAKGNPVQVLISPIVPVTGVDGDAAASASASSSVAATVLPPAYTGVLYLHHHMKAAAAAAVALGQLNEPKKKREMWLKEMPGWLMVLAVLAPSVTYQAGLNPPGGFWQQNDSEGHVAGTPVLQSNFPKRYNNELRLNHGEIFYFNATAFLTSVVIIILLMNESFYHSEVKVEALEIIVVLDMVGLMGAFIAGSTRTVPCSIYVIVLTVVVFLYVVYTAELLPKIWWLLIDVPWVHDAATGGKLPVPHHIVEQASPHHRRADDVDRSKAAPPR